MVGDFVVSVCKEVDYVYRADAVAVLYKYIVQCRNVFWIIVLYGIDCRYIPFSAAVTGIWI